MDDSGIFHGFYFTNTPLSIGYLANQIPLCPQVVDVSRLGIFPNKAKALITKYWGSTLPALPPSASSPIKTTYCVSAAPCAFYSQYNYCDIQKKVPEKLSLTGT